MIFVTVGTHEQPFDRLIKSIDNLTGNGDIKEKVIIQTGFSTYIPKNCESYKMMSYDEMQQALKTARIIVTHGGPSSFVEALQFKKIPIVVPRQAQFNEHINDHQVDFVKLIDKRMNNIIPVYNIKKLKKTILDYDIIVRNKNIKENSNNRRFNMRLGKIIEEL